NACDATTFRVTLDGSPNRWAAPGPEGITGTIEQATATVVSGWATDRDANGNPITVHIYGRRDVPGVPHGESAAPGPGGCRPDQLPGRAGRHHHVEGRQAPLPRRRPQPEQLAGDRAGRR